MQNHKEVVKMHYDECIIEGEMFYQVTPGDGWIRATNSMLTSRLEKMKDELAEANEVLANVQKLIKEYWL
jgi:hypothetical protein